MHISRTHTHTHVSSGLDQWSFLEFAIPFNQTLATNIVLFFLLVQITRTLRLRNMNKTTYLQTEKKNYIKNCPRKINLIKSTNERRKEKKNKIESTADNHFYMYAVKD